LAHISEEVSWVRRRGDWHLGQPSEVKSELRYAVAIEENGLAKRFNTQIAQAPLEVTVQEQEVESLISPIAQGINKTNVRDQSLNT
jgi:hypothetical protein